MVAFKFWNNFAIQPCRLYYNFLFSLLYCNNSDPEVKKLLGFQGFKERSDSISSTSSQSALQSSSSTSAQQVMVDLSPNQYHFPSPCVHQTTITSNCHWIASVFFKADGSMSYKSAKTYFFLDVWKTHSLWLISSFCCIYSLCQLHWSVGHDRCKLWRVPYMWW